MAVLSLWTLDSLALWTGKWGAARLLPWGSLGKGEPTPEQTSTEQAWPRPLGPREIPCWGSSLVHLSPITSFCPANSQPGFQGSSPLLAVSGSTRPPPVPHVPTEAHMHQGGRTVPHTMAGVLQGRGAADFPGIEARVRMGPAPTGLSGTITTSLPPGPSCPLPTPPWSWSGRSQAGLEARGAPWSTELGPVSPRPPDPSATQLMY